MTISGEQGALSELSKADAKPNRTPAQVRTAFGVEGALRGYSLVVEEDVPIPMRDGLHLAANVYRPDSPGRYPVIMSFTVFGKDGAATTSSGRKLTETYEVYSPHLAETAPFEAPEPAFWCPYGYVVIHVDVRGSGRSPGRVLPPIDIALAKDYYDAIEWAARQEWCNGNVGLMGVSYLGFTQWRVAALNPPHLKAIVPWMAMTSRARDHTFPGGIPQTGFNPWHAWGVGEVVNPRPAWPAPDGTADKWEAPSGQAEDDFLKDIRVPALICAGWGDAGNHLRGSLRAFRTIGSKHKWLYTHGRLKWATFYSTDARAVQKLFLDCFLQGTDTRILAMPRVILGVRDSYERHLVRFEDDFPIPDTRYTRWYLDAANGTLTESPPPMEQRVSYDADNGYAAFDWVFSEDTELTGYMKLKLWVSPEHTDDMDLFIAVRKYARDGREVLWDEGGLSPRPIYPVTVGWLRLSHRGLDEEKSTEWEPYQKYVVAPEQVEAAHGPGGLGPVTDDVVGPPQKVKPGSVVPVEIPLMPSSTLFHPGERLRLVVSGNFKFQMPPEATAMNFESINSGTHSVYTGGRYDSYLLVPVVPCRRT